MTIEEQEIKKYINEIKHLIKAPNSMKKRISADLAQDINARIEKGESFADIRQDLGTPVTAAASFNTELCDCIDRGSKWQYLFLGFLALLCVFAIAMSFLHGKSAASSIGIIGGADGPTSIFLTYDIPSLTFSIIIPFISVALSCVAAYLLLRRHNLSRKYLYITLALSAVPIIAQIIFFIYNIASSSGMLFGGFNSTIIFTICYNLLSPAFWLPIVTFVVSLVKIKKLNKNH